MGSTENFHSKENIRENLPDWVKEQIRDWLNNLSQNVEETAEVKSETENQTQNLAVESFYSINGDQVEYNMDAVKSYLNSLKDQKWVNLNSKNTTAWIMAVQIALESNGYDVGTIDWFLWGWTKAGVERFQQENGLKVDWLPGKETISKLLNVLNWESNSENNPNNSENEVSDWDGENWKIDWSEESEQKQGKLEKDNSEYGIWKLWEMKIRIFTIQSLADLPKNYKWKDPEKYELNDPNTYPKVYKYKDVLFYSNGRCEYKWEMYNSSTIMERLKNGRYDKENYNDVRFVIDELKNRLWDSLKLKIDGKEYDIWVMQMWKKVKLFLDNKQYNFSEMFSVWDFLDKDWTFMTNYVQQVVLKEAEKKIIEQYKAEQVKSEFSKIISSKEYSFEDIFWDMEKTARYNNYFTEMDRAKKKIVFDKNGLVRKWLNIKFELDNDWSNKDYNKFDVHYSELTDRNGKFSEAKLKAFLKKKITGIVNKHF